VTAESLSHWLFGRRVTVRSRHFQILGRETELFSRWELNFSGLSLRFWGKNYESIE
jgi:hypothetical protein